MAVLVVLYLVVFISGPVALCQTPPLLRPIDAQPLCPDQENQNNDNHLIYEMRELKLKIARLETFTEESIQGLNAKSVCLEEREKLIEEMGIKIQHLQTALLSLKGDSLRASERLCALEEEVQLLWAASRKNNFDIHLLESKVQDAEETLEAATSQVEKMANIVTEQWIQVQQLEQALQMTKMRAMKAQKLVGSTGCTFLKFINDFFGNYLQKVSEMYHSTLYARGLTSQALHHIKVTLSSAKSYHHKLQGFIRQKMERNEFTAALANEELVFFVASVILIFPIMSAWTLLSSQFS